MKKDKQSYFKNIESLVFPKGISNMLQEAALLYHVPIAYILPNSNLIKNQEIRFFQIDHNWIVTYMDGICSPGRNAAIDYSHDTWFLLDEYKKALRKQNEVRQRLRDEPVSRSNMNELGICSGFLLHSELVEDYRGLEFHAYNERSKGSELPILRIEKLSEHLMIGIFQGEVKRLEIAQPPEGIHYGFIKGEDDSLKKTLRDMASGKLTQVQIDVPLRNKELHIIDFDTVALRLNAHYNMDIHSKEIALTFIQNAHSAVFTME